MGSDVGGRIGEESAGFVGSGETALGGVAEDADNGGFGAIDADMGPLVPAGELDDDKGSSVLAFGSSAQETRPHAASSQPIVVPGRAFGRGRAVRFTLRGKFSKPYSKW